MLSGHTFFCYTHINTVITVYLEKLVDAYTYDSVSTVMSATMENRTDTELTLPLIGTAYPDNL